MHRQVYESWGCPTTTCACPPGSEDPKGREKYVDNPQAWDRTQTFVRKAMQESGLPFVEVKGEAAFYGRRSTSSSAR